VQAAEERRRLRRLEEEEESKAYKLLLAQQQQLGEGDHLLDSSQERFNNQHPPPHTLGACFFGLLLLCTSVGFYFLFTRVLDPVSETFLNDFPLTVIFLGFLTLGFLSSIAVLIRDWCRPCKSSDPEHFTLYHIAWAGLTEVFIVGLVMMFWYLNDIGMCAEVTNQCAVIFSLDLILLVLFTIPWYHERSDISMAIFVVIIGAATTLLFWDEAQHWEWDDFKVHYKEVLVVAGGVVALALAVMSLRKSMSHGESGYFHLLQAHMFFGTVFSLAPVLALEIIPSWKSGYLFHFITWDTLWRLVVCFSFVVVFLYALKGLSRYSDALTTGYSAKLSALLPHLAKLIEDLVKNGDFKSWAPLKIAAFCVVLLCLAYWFVRVPLLNFCWKRKHKTYQRLDD